MQTFAETEHEHAEIVLAECSGQGWLVRGEQHIDDLLGNTLHADVSIEVVACESKSAIDALWRRWNDGGVEDMWMIHPAIMGRVRGQPAGTVLAFTPWSAAIDAAGQKVIDLAALGAAARPEALLAIVRHVQEGADRSAGDLAGLRCTLIEGRLAEAGVTSDRIVREDRPATRPEDAEQILILLR